MIEAVNYIPEAAITGGAALIWFLIRRYLKNQDSRYAALASDFKEFSKNFMDGLSSLMIQQATDNEKHTNVEKRLERVDSDIDTLYDRSNEVSKKVVKLEAEIS